MRLFIQVLIKVGLTLNFLRLIPYGLMTCLVASNLNPSFLFIHIALAIGGVFVALYLVLQHHNKSAWVLSLVFHLYEAGFWCFAIAQSGFRWTYAALYLTLPLVMSCLAVYVLYQYHGYEKARKFHSAV